MIDSCKTYHILVENSILDKEMMSILSRIKCDGILLLCEDKPELSKYPPIPIFPIVISKESFTWESLNKLHLELSRFTEIYYKKPECLVTVYVCLNPSQVNTLVNYSVYQCLSYLHVLSIKINNINPRSTTPALSIVTYTIYDNEAIFLPFLSTKTPEVLNALLEICSENETVSKNITTKNLEEALSGDEISLKSESIKNRFLHLKKQLRGYPGYKESFRGIQLEVFRLEFTS